jgi:crotonobetainyl-CoA:carnitine CoA-transferase CaiB-like acyl-CoA transferase
MLPLQGLRLIAVEQYGAGPYGTMQLADLGAEVIKIENPREGGDTARRVGPFLLGDNDSHFFQSFNRNKRSLTLDLKQPAAREVLAALARQADGLLDNLRGDQPERLGLTYEALKAANPRIVCAHLSAYGGSGARASWPGYDYLMQAEAGYFTLTGVVPAAPVNGLAAALDSDFTRERGMIAAVPHPARPDFRMLGQPIRGAGAMPRRAAPALGADTDAILRDCGFSPERIAALRRDGVV